MAQQSCPDSREARLAERFLREGLDSENAMRNSRVRGEPSQKEFPLLNGRRIRIGTLATTHQRTDTRDHLQCFKEVHARRTSNNRIRRQ